MGEVQDFLDINEIADLLNRDVDEIEELVERCQIPHYRDLEIVTPTGKKFFKLAFPKQEVLSKIEPRKGKRKKVKKEEPKTEEPIEPEVEEKE